MSKSRWIWGCTLAFAACAESGDPETIATQEIVNGVPAPTKRFVTEFRGECSSVLIHDRYVLTAGHCIHYNNSDITHGEGITVDDSNNHNAVSFAIQRAHTFGHLGDARSPKDFTSEPTGNGGTTDVALAQLESSVPFSIAEPVEVATAYPPRGAWATLFGFGCTARNQPQTLLGPRRSFTYHFGSSTQALCEGDSGGPAVIGDANGFSPWGINVGFDGSGNDVFGSAVFYEDKIMGLVQAWEGTTFEVGFDRAGGDFSAFDLPAGAAPADCRAACQASDVCRAFTYVEAGVYGPTPRCFLKSAIQGWRPCGPCTSGTLLSQEVGIDRNGSDYSSFTLPEARPELCLAACARDAACRAYSYTPPGYFVGQPAVCFLKNGSGDRVANAQVTSGLRRGFEIDYDRDGADYRWFKTSSADPDSCRITCAQESQCHAFTYIAAGVTEPSAECHLKMTPGSPIRHSGMTSAMKRGLEMAMDRSGGDLRNFELSIGVPEVCQAECAKDGACAAFTFAPPGYAGLAKAHCWLKSSITAQSYNEPLISGLKGAEFF